MQEIVGVLGAQHAELDALVAGLDEDGLATASACPGWSISDVVLHLAQTDDMARASLAGRFGEHLEGQAAVWAMANGVDDGAGMLVDAERGASGAAVRQRWRDGAAALRTALLATDPSARVPWVVGDLAARTLGSTRLAECWIHTTDVAVGLGVELPATDRLRPIARLAWRTLPYAFATAGIELHGPVAFELTGPDGQPWSFVPADGDAATTIRGTALDLCRVAGQRADVADTALVGEGPDAAEVLRLVRTFA